jgi:hypothetical protein
MKKETVKSIKKVSRKKIPLSFLKEKVLPSRKRKLIEKALKKERNEEFDGGTHSKDRM